MGLSKKNLRKLNTFIKNNKVVHNNTSSENSQESHNASKVEDPSKIFYSIIDNSEHINQTSEENQLLKKSEGDFHNINSIKTNNSNNLSLQEELYDEFNYLLEE